MLTILSRQGIYRRGGLLAFCCCLLLAAGAGATSLMAAAEGFNDAPPASEEPITTTPLFDDEGDGYGVTDRFTGQFAKMMFTLTVFIGLIVLLSWLLKRVAYTRMQQVNTTSTIKVLERRTLSPKSSVYVLEVYGNRILVGETPAGLTALASLPPQSDDDDVRQSPFNKLLAEPPKQGQ